MCLQLRFSGRIRLSSICVRRVRGPGSATARMQYRRCAQPWTIFSGQANSYTAYGAPRFLVETLLDRGADADVAEAEAAITRSPDAPADEGLVIREIWLLRLRALLDEPMATIPPIATIGIATATWRKRLASRVIAWAEAMNDGGKSRGLGAAALV